MAKQRSKPQRWADACSSATEAVEAARAALEDLRDLMGEYEEWRDNMPESLQESATFEKLEEVIDSGESNFDEFESACDSLESAISDIQDMDLPRGFGRD